VAHLGKGDQKKERKENKEVFRGRDAPHQWGESGVQQLTEKNHSLAGKDSTTRKGLVETGPAKGGGGKKKKGKEIQVTCFDELGEVLKVISR